MFHNAVTFYYHFEGLPFIGSFSETSAGIDVSFHLQYSILWFFIQYHRYPWLTYKSLFWSISLKASSFFNCTFLVNLDFIIFTKAPYSCTKIIKKCLFWAHLLPLLVVSKQVCFCTCINVFYLLKTSFTKFATFFKFFYKLLIL